MTQIRAARWKSALELEISTVELDGPGAGEVQVSIQSAGICGSDLHAFRNTSGSGKNSGLVPGHEIAGVVSAIGVGVGHVREGAMQVMGRAGERQVAGLQNCLVALGIDTVPGYSIMLSTG